MTAQALALAHALDGRVPADDPDVVELPGAIVRCTFRGEVVVETIRHGRRKLGRLSDGPDVLAAAYRAMCEAAS